MTSCYRSFIPNYAILVAPINKLVRKKQPWAWGLEQQAAFIDIKTQIMEALTLVHPNFNNPFYVHTDASTTGLGAVLMQHDESTKPLLNWSAWPSSGPLRNFVATWKAVTSTL